MVMGIALACNSLYPPEWGGDARTHCRPTPSHRKVRFDTMAQQTKGVDFRTLATRQNSVPTFWDTHPEYLNPAFLTSDEKNRIIDQQLTFEIRGFRLVSTQYGPTWWLTIRIVDADTDAPWYTLSMQDNESRNHQFMAMRDHIEKYDTTVRTQMIRIETMQGDAFVLIPPVESPQMALPPTEPQSDNHTEDVPF